MGAVYKARDREVERFVALKVIRPDLASRPDILARFKQELILARQVTHKNVIRIFDLGEADGVKYITMDFIEGEDLKTLLREKGKLTSEEAVKIITQICRALDAAHTEGVVHRDLKPQNIMLDSKGRVTVMDFGIARSLEMPGMTQTGALVGTPEYMSPEQAKGEEVDARSDLFTTGIIFYELLTGNTPFRADTAYATLLKRTQERARPPIELDPTIPPNISSVVMKCLEKDKELRYASALDIVHDLGQQTVTLSRTAPPAVVVPTAPSGLATVLQHRKWIAIGGVAVILLAVAFAFRDHLLPGARSKRSAGGPTVSLLILPFRNASGDQSLNWLGSGLAEMLTTDVGQSTSLRIVSGDRMHEILRDLHVASDAELDQGTLRQIAEFTKADQIVSGQYVKLGEQIRIDATLQDLKQQRTVSLKAEAPSEKEVLHAVDQLAQSIQKNLALPSGSVEELKAAAFTPSSKSVEALRDYDAGLQLAREGKYPEAVKSFEASTKDDPAFALAWAKLGEANFNLGYGNQAQEFTRKAVDISESLPRPEKLRILAISARVENNAPKAIDAYENLAKLSPDDSDVEFNLASLYQATGDYDKAKNEYTKLLARDPKHVDALIGIGRTETLSGNAPNSLDYLNRALTLSIQLGNDQQRSGALYNLGVAYREMSKLDDALRNLQEALAAKRRLGDKRGTAAALNAMGQTFERLGKPADAQKSYQESLELRQSIGDKKGMGDTLMNLGNFYDNQGQFDEALKRFKESLQIQHDAGDVVYEGTCLNNIAAAYFFKGQYQDSLTYLQQALQVREKAKVTLDIAQTLHNLGDSSAMVGQFDQAQNYYLRAMELWKTAGDRLDLAIESNSMGTVFEFQGRYGAALKAKDEAQRIVREVGERGYVLADILGNYGHILALVGRDEEAQKVLEESLSSAREAKSDPLIGQTLNFQGDRLFYRGDFKGSQNLYEQAQQLALKTKDPYPIIVTKVNLARVAIKQGRYAAAVSSLKELAREADSRNLKYISVECSLYLGEALLGTKDFSLARQELDDARRKSEDLKLQVLLAQSQYFLGTELNLTNNQTEASRHFAESRRILEEIQKESQSDSLLKRSDLSPIIAGSH